MNDAIVVFNAGSSSIKFAIYDLAKGTNEVVISGKIVNIGQQPTFSASNSEGSNISEDLSKSFNSNSSHEALSQWLLDYLQVYLAQHKKSYRLQGVGHRMVHGGVDFVEPILVTPQIMDKLSTLIPLAPLHQPHNLSTIDAVMKWAPHLPQVACFDTSFHSTQSTMAKLFALPWALSEEGIIRYGFHGISYEYINRCLPEYLGDLSKGRIIVAHLGNGASMCAIKDGKSVSTSMGFTALDGLMMGQRCGTLDAGVVLHLLTEKSMSIEQVQHILYNESGLLGVSGISNNMRVLQQSNEERAKLAIDLFCFRAASELASLVNSIQGLDAIVFTAGIGENSAAVREQICEQLVWLGVSLNSAANDAHKSVISNSDSAVKVLVIPTNEEIVIAQATRRLLG